jgi:N-acyl-D-aspartate/D-glutamate deacylase
MSEHFDLLIRGGTLVDGTGAPAVAGDLGIRDGRIAAMGTDLGSADRSFDASGCHVSPGFVDIHTHYDAQIFWDRMLTISPWHGVTSVVMGNCGFGVAPTRAEHRDLILRTLENVEGMSLDALWSGLGDDWPFESFPEYLDAIENRGSAINVGALVGHTPIRMYVMGEEATEREASADEVEQMQALVREALGAGAIGFATSWAPTHVGYSGRPVPSRASALSEIHALAECLGEAGHGTLQATLGRGLFLNEFTEIFKATNRPISWTALLGGMMGPDGHRRVLEESEKLQQQGIGIYPQVTPRPLMFEFQWKAPFPFESLSMFKPVSQADFEGKKRIYADAEFRHAFRERGESPGNIAGRWSDTVIADVPGQPDLSERCVEDVARERNMHPADLALDLGLETDLEARFRIAVANADPAIVEELITHPAAMLGLSDAGAHASQLCDACQPTHLLARWVRDRGALSVEAAVRLLTSRSAEVFGVPDRGRLEVGLAADVTVFDLDRVDCSPLRRVNDLPTGADRLISDAVGVEAVIVNGTPIRERGKDCVDPDGDLPGRVLRGGPAS